MNCIRKPLEKVLIIRNQGIGDLILISPAIRAIRELHPQAYVAILVGAWSRVAVEGNPHIDEIISYPDSWIQDKKPFGYLRLIARLAKRRFDIAYVFHSHNLIHLMAYLAAIPRRFGFYDLDLKKSGKLLTDKAVWQPNTSRYVAENYLDVPRLVGWRGEDSHLDFFLSPIEQDSADQIIRERQLQAGAFFVVAPGGGVNPRQNVFEKRWGAERFAALGDLLQREWGLPLLLTGSQQEIELGKQIEAHSSVRIINLIGRIPFKTSAGLVRRSRMLISNDSAIMHVAVAFGVPSLAIFGPSNPRSLLPDSQINQWITSELECSPCYCNSIFPGCEHLNCMNSLHPEQVLERISTMLAQNAQRTEKLT